MLKKGRRHCRAFTLVELVIGMGLLLLLAVIFFTLIKGGTRESALSSDHFTGAMLSQKVTEDLIEELGINPYGIQTLGLDETAPLTPTQVIDGSVPFFKTTEDSKPPWGKIDDLTEGTINNKVLPLYNQVRTFQLSGSGKRMQTISAAPENQHLIDSAIRFDWTAKAGKGYADSRCHFFSSSGPKPVEVTLLYDQAQLEKEIAYSFFNSPGDSLTNLVSTTGANYQTVLSLGIIHHTTLGFINSNGLDKYLQEVKNAKNKVTSFSFSDKAEEYQAKQNLARAYFDLGNACFMLTYLIATEVARLEGKCETTDLGYMLTAFPENFTSGLKNYIKIYNTYQDSLESSCQAYLSLLQPGISGAKGLKQQLSVILRLMEIHQIIAVNPDIPGGLSRYNTYLEALKTSMQGRNQYLHRYALQEKTFAVSNTLLVEKHPFLQRIQEVTSGSVPIIREILKKYP
ncbi:MAG: type II secretion system protein [Candidatus Riflebacteria bacterium]|nr:type II secretion system protein [Candidatus Riflebacteria bacterium]